MVYCYDYVDLAAYSEGESGLAPVGFSRSFLTFFVNEAMVDWSDATFQLHAVLPADCKGFRASLRSPNTIRFAFVEYESRRDADDAYYEMHNKRIGRDELLKIEVCHYSMSCDSTLNFSLVGSYSALRLLAL